MGKCVKVTLIALILTFASGGNPQPHHSPARSIGQFSSPAAQSWSEEGGDERTVQLCNQRLLNTITYVCRSSGVVSRQPAPSGQRNSVRQPQQEEYPRGVAGGRDGSSMNDGLFHQKKPQLPRNIVDECCKNPCKVSQFLKYCDLFRTGMEERRTTSTTTPSPPPPFRSHRLVRTKVTPALGPPPNLTKPKKPSLPEVQEIREELIREGIQCLLDPNCPYRDEERGQPPTSSSPHKRLKKTKRKKDETPPGISLPKLCTSGMKKTKKGRKTGQPATPTRRKEREEDSSTLVPLLLRLLTWGVQQKEPLQPQLPEEELSNLLHTPVDHPPAWSPPKTSWIVVKDDLEGLTSSYNSPSRHNLATGGGWRTGGSRLPSSPFSSLNNSPSQSFPNSYDKAEVTTGRRRDEGQANTFGHSEDRLLEGVVGGGRGRMEMIFVTDPPLRPSIGFPSGTFDGISFSK